MTITILCVFLTASVALNIALMIIAAWQHRIIKVAAEEIGVKI